MRPLALASTAAALLLLTGCAAAAPASPGAPPPPQTSAPAAPSAGLEPGPEARARLADLPVPSADGEVLAIGTALQTADGPPMLCAMVLTSYPPQCGGPEIEGWDWSAVAHEEASGVRWTEASIAFLADHDAAAGTLAVVEMLDLATLSMPAYEEPSGSIDQATATAIQADLMSLDRADIRGSAANADVATLEVVYDDGSMQAFLDDLYGPGAVWVESWLR